MFMIGSIKIKDYPDLEALKRLLVLTSWVLGFNFCFFLSKAEFTITAYIILL